LQDNNSLTAFGTGTARVANTLHHFGWHNAIGCE
jgi:hypothetical protein